MEIKDGRGESGRQIAKENLKKIKDFFAEKPNATVTECCRELNLSYLTVRKHINKLIGA